MKAPRLLVCALALTGFVGGAAAAPDAPAGGESANARAYVGQLSKAILSGKLAREEMAEALKRRGVILSDLYELDAALRDLKRAAELTPADESILVERAFVQEKLGNSRAALADLDQAIAAKPDDARARLLRALVRYYGNDLRHAEADFAQTVELADRAAREVRGYAVLWLYWTRLRLGKDDRQLLAAADPRGPTSWPAAANRLFRREITTRQLLAAAADKDPRVERAQTCEAHFFIGQFHLLSGRPLLAQASFENALATEARSAIEYVYAKRELARLAK